jgi:3-hydroxyisobutyrate dehydrogenase-like beta-hydroxyacid dehydrogenase
MAIILSNADKHRSQLPLLKLASELFRKASEMGHDTEDASVLYPTLYGNQQDD